MRSVYLDNAATTKLDPEVLDEMMLYLTDEFGNPSSTHHYGRKTKSAIEISRRKIAKMLSCKPSEIIFTSGGTEADNMALNCAVRDLEVTHIITSAIEHHAVGHTVEELEKAGKIRMSLVNLDEQGYVDLNHLEELLKTEDKTLVSLMHANNEIGTKIDLHEIGDICKKYDAYFHSDTVQTMAHYLFDLSDIKIDFITGAAHKFHGPKGVGFLFVRENVNIKQMIYGGGQERQMRGGTENLYGIVGIGKAMEVAYRELEEHQEHVMGVKQHMINLLEANIPGVEFNGDPKGDSLYTILNVLLPETANKEMLLFSLDLKGIACSGGSACSSGSSKGSHVLTAIGADSNRPSVRFSFSKYTSNEDVEYAVEALKELIGVPV